MHRQYDATSASSHALSYGMCRALYYRTGRRSRLNQIWQSQSCAASPTPFRKCTCQQLRKRAVPRAVRAAQRPAHSAADDRQQRPAAPWLAAAAAAALLLSPLDAHAISGGKGGMCGRLPVIALLHWAVTLSGGRHTAWPGEQLERSTIGQTPANVVLENEYLYVLCQA